MKKLIAILILAAVLCASCIPALAEQYAYVKTPTSDGTVYVRSVAGAGQPVVGVANNGDTLIILSKGNTWHKVKVLRTGIEGYMYGAYIQFINSSSSSSSSSSSWSSSSSSYTPAYTPDASVTDKDTVLNKYGTVSSSDGYANLRWGPGTDYGIITQEYNGTQLWILEQNGLWYRCCDNYGRVGYVNRKLVTLGSTVSYSGKTGVIRSSDGYAAIRSGAGTSNQVLYSLNAGQNITIYGVSGDWFKVSSFSSWSDAYIYRTLIRFYSAAKTTGNVNLRTGPGTSYSKAGVVNNGSKVTLLATNGSFSRVDTGSAIGYVSNKYLSY